MNAARKRKKEDRIDNRQKTLDSFFAPKKRKIEPKKDEEHPTATTILSPPVSAGPSLLPATAGKKKPTLSELSSSRPQRSSHAGAVHCDPYAHGGSSYPPFVQHQSVGFKSCILQLRMDLRFDLRPSC